VRVAAVRPFPRPSHALFPLGYAKPCPFRQITLLAAEGKRKASAKGSPTSNILIWECLLSHDLIAQATVAGRNKPRRIKSYQHVGAAVIVGISRKAGAESRTFVIRATLSYNVAWNARRAGSHHPQLDSVPRGFASRSSEPPSGAAVHSRRWFRTSGRSPPMRQCRASIRRPSQPP